MKFLLFTISILLFTLPQDLRLKGNYIMKYEEDYVSQNCSIKFDNKSYKRLLTNGKNVKGKVEYSNQKIVLNDKNTSLQMEFFKEEILNDTIYFKTKDLRKITNNNKKGGMIIYSGKLIRIK